MIHFKFTEIQEILLSFILHLFYLSSQIAIVNFVWQNLFYTVTDQDVVFLVSDSCCGTISNGKIISADTIENV